MVATTNAGTKLISDIVFLTQRATGETCDVVARTVARQTARFLEKMPGDVKNANAFSLTTRKLCECVLQLRGVVSGSGEEILIKRQALDLLLALCNELEHEAEQPVDREEPYSEKLARSA